MRTGETPVLGYGVKQKVSWWLVTKVLVIGGLAGVLMLSEGYVGMTQRVQSDVMTTSAQRRAGWGDRALDLCDSLGRLFR